MSEVPVAYCDMCQMNRVVLVDEFKGQTAVYCPHCDSILSMGKDVKVHWFEEEELR